MFRYSHIPPITRHNNVHYPLQNVIRDKAWKKKDKTLATLKEKNKEVIKQNLKVCLYGNSK
jgi:hypothetical protein